MPIRQLSCFALSLILAGSSIAAVARTLSVDDLAGLVKNAFTSEFSQAKTFEAGTTYSVCFTPGQNCEGLVVNEIHRAKSSILMQAYSFTSAPIAKALSEAKSRGVDVRAILDKSQRTEKYTGATYLKNAGIPVVIDEKPAIAHNKVFIFDQQAVLTGSFNFSKAAQTKNAENLIVIRGDSSLTKSYSDNWTSRWKVSVDY